LVKLVLFAFVDTLELLDYFLLGDFCGDFVGVSNLVLLALNDSLSFDYSKSSGISDYFAFPVNSFFG